VFRDGLFHADPHPGNLFVVDEPGAAERPRVLFIDFGLSRRR
jgi:predicted unusual protein kinase regulating ubiquinone biosynthesis (AarF/ABC1/UbiB family)